MLASQLIVIRHDQGRLGELTDLIAQTLNQNPRLTGYRSVLCLAYYEQRRGLPPRRLITHIEQRAGSKPARCSEVALSLTSYEPQDLMLCLAAKHSRPRVGAE